MSSRDKKNAPSAANWDEVRRLFHECLDLPLARRRAFLDDKTNDPEVRKEVDALLAALPEDSAFDRPLATRLLSPTKKIELVDLFDQPFAPFFFEKYLVVEKIGEGGMAEIYLALVEGPGGFEKQLALKRVSADFDDSSFEAFLLNEAALCAQLTHANIAQVFECTRTPSGCVLAMEYIPGKNLSQLHKRTLEAGEPFPLSAALHIVAEICRGLDYAHRLTNPSTGLPLQIVHRDVNPKNIMISYDGAIKVVDFGIASAIHRKSVTGTGLVRGTVLYFSPEQAQRLPLDGRSDIFSACLILYNLIAGETLFPMDDTSKMAERLCKGDVALQKLSELDAPAPIVEILRRGLAVDREHRYSGAAELYEALISVVGGSFLEREESLRKFLKRLFPQELTQERSRLNRARAMMASERSTPAPLPTPPRPRSRKLLAFFAAFAFSVLITASLILFNQTDAEEPRTPASEPTKPKSERPILEHECLLSVVTEPETAEVFVDQIYMGKTPHELRVGCGKTFELFLRKAGFKEIRQQIVIYEKSSRAQFRLMLP